MIEIGINLTNVLISFMALTSFCFVLFFWLKWLNNDN